MKAWCVKRSKKIDGGRGENVTMSYKMLQHTCMSRPAFNNFGGNYLVPHSDIMLVSGAGGGGGGKQQGLGPRNDVLTTCKAIR